MPIMFRNFALGNSSKQFKHYTIMLNKINISEIKISANGRNVRYQGKVQDKCNLSNLIHDLAFQVGYTCFPLWSDIYWYESTKIELVNYLKEFIAKA